MSSKLALEKLLTNLVLKEYPIIKDVMVVDNHLSDDTHAYNIILQVNRDESFGENGKLHGEIKDYVYKLSKYMLGKNEHVRQIAYYAYEPNN
jgi:hypothetical protein